MSEHPSLKSIGAGCLARPAAGAGNLQRTHRRPGFHSRKRKSTTDVPSHMYMTGREHSEESHEQTPWLHGRDETEISTEYPGGRCHEHTLTRAGEPQIRRWRARW